MTWGARIQAAAAIFGGVGAYRFFASRPAMQVLVGTRALGELVPAHYQAIAFPPFAAFVAAGALEWRNDRRTALRRASLVVLTGALAIARLSGALPLSGHALFLAAALAFDASSTDDGRSLRLALSLFGLSVTAFYKLCVWGDPAWFAASIAGGAAIGVSLSRSRAQ